MAVKNSDKSSEQQANVYCFAAKLWRYDGPAAWHFVTLPEKLAAEIEAFHSHLKKDFGSIAVQAHIRESNWKTSIFRDTKRKSYLLPVKAEIRKREKLAAGDEVYVTLHV